MDKSKLKIALAEAAMTIGTSPMARSAFAQIITEVINPVHLSLNAISSFMNVRTVPAGTVVEGRVRTTLPVRVFVPGTEHLADQIFTRNIYQMQTEELISKIRYPLRELQRGDIVTVDSLRQEMSKAIIDEFVAKAFSLLSTVWVPYTHSLWGSFYTDASATGITEEILDTAVEQVLKSSSSVRGIIGTRAALYPLYKTGGVVEHTVGGDTTVLGIPNILEEWKRDGKISRFHGNTLVELPQVYRKAAGNYDVPLLPDQYILVVGAEAGEFILQGDFETQEHVDTSIEPPDYSLAMWRRYGMLVNQPESVAIIKIK